MNGLVPRTLILCAALTAATAHAQHTPAPPDIFSNEPVFALDIGASVDSAYFGLASIAVVMGAALAASVIAEPGTGRANTVAALDILYAGLAIPLVAAGGASARGHPFVTGVEEARHLGWLGWTLSIAGGIALLAMDLDRRSDLAPLVLAPAAVGSLSLLAFSLDAIISALQVDLVRRLH